MELWENCGRIVKSREVLKSVEQNAIDEYEIGEIVKMEKVNFRYVIM